jgi:hypothetical protein
MAATRLHDGIGRVDVVPGESIPTCNGEFLAAALACIATLMVVIGGDDERDNEA